MNHTDPTAPIRKSLLPCTPPPEWEFSSAFATGPDDQPGLLLVPGDSGPVVVRRLVTYGDWEPVRPDRWADEPETDCAAASAVVSPPTDRADLRDRIADAIRQAACPGNCSKTEEECARERIQPVAWHHGRLAVVEGEPERIADALLAVLGEQTDRAAVLLWAADHFDRMGRTVLAASQVRDALRRLAVEAHDTGTQQPTRCTCTHARAMHTGTGLFCAVPDCECARYTGAQQQPDTEAPTEEQIVRDHVTSLHLIGEQLATIESWMWQLLFEVREAAAQPAPVAQQPAAAPEHTGGNAEDCPVCRPEIDKTVLYPWICTGPLTSKELADAQADVDALDTEFPDAPRP